MAQWHEPCICGLLMRTLVVSNRAAGTVAPDFLKEHLVDPLGEEGHWLEFDGNEEDVKARLAESIAAFRPARVVACGGDGTVASVATVLDRLDAGIELAVVPMGTANVFALELGLGNNLVEACALARDGEARRHDLLRTRDGVALCRILVGNLSEPGQSSTPQSKRRWKLLSYFFYGLPYLLRPRGHRFKLKLDGRTIHTRASSVIVCNAGQTGWAHGTWAPQVRADDGVADIVVLHSASFRDHLRLIWSRMWGRQERCPVVTRWTARKHIRIHLPSDVTCSRDGERLQGRVIDIDVVPGGIPVVAAPRPMEDAVDDDANEATRATGPWFAPARA